ncbi:uncharacterized protein F5891DRAFT_988542 [Suillus fuscotomentosus]|uniref:Uncharacterized protein n=1 Tax=Suillus fuscotomentosus TaxID=1912939 RepID=A0AAD4HCK6_9AGAM|nr:uncharacterized protein F5891DRAFT_988542 [Suillus fuscotomentosus]KAG1886926.1 hypothetical protein F5891DRAFT_988542 [Suillus fuscotomentosus]
MDPSSPSSTITAPPDYHETALTLARLATEAMTCKFALLHYDSVSKTMIEWYWPDDEEGKKVPPSNFEKYRDERKFQYPCCLCAFSTRREAYTEAAVYPWRDKATNKLYWNARCTSDTLKIDIHYHRSSLVTFIYPLRGEHEKPCLIQLEWTRREQKDLMAKLDSSIGDGITATEFRILFRHCKLCKRVGARPVMNHHILACSGGVQKQRLKQKSRLFVIDETTK